MTGRISLSCCGRFLHGLTLSAIISRINMKSNLPPNLKKTVASENKELIELGKKLQAFYDSGYINRKQALMFSFLKGIAAGFGAFLGGTIVVALLLWMLSQFQYLPFVKNISNSVQDTIQQK